jgi:hypothetical protein
MFSRRRVSAPDARRRLKGTLAPWAWRRVVSRLGSVTSLEVRRELVPIGIGELDPEQAFAA